MSPEVMKYGKTVFLPLVSGDSVRQQRRATHQDHGRSAYKAVQVLRPEVHSQEPKALGEQRVRRDWHRQPGATNAAAAGQRRARAPTGMNIIRWAFRLLDRAVGYAGHARRFYYEIMLLGHSCPRCDGKPSMAREGLCRCGSCGHQFDPTVAFQRCPTCGGPVKLHIRRYHCSACGADVRSKFLFDGLVFDADYFRQRMAESRQRRRQQRAEVRRLLANSRSQDLAMPGADLNDIPGLVDALNALSAGQADHPGWMPSEGLDLKRYQGHIRAHLRDVAVSLEEIPPLGEDARRDRIWRFVAIIFLAHEGVVDLRQEGPTILVMKHDDTKGPDFLEGTEELDGLKGSVGRAQAW
jgi:hypothetical protein